MEIISPVLISKNTDQYLSMGSVLGILCQRCRRRGNTQIIQTKKVKKTKESQQMSQRMKNFTAARDEQLDQDVEGQMLAGVLAT